MSEQGFISTVDQFTHCQLISWTQAGADATLNYRFKSLCIYVYLRYVVPVLAGTESHLINILVSRLGIIGGCHVVGFADHLFRETIEFSAFSVKNCQQRITLCVAEFLLATSKETPSSCEQVSTAFLSVPSSRSFDFMLCPFAARCNKTQ